MTTVAGQRLLADMGQHLRLPIVVAPMFLISGPDMVIAAGRGGVMGALPAPNARTIEMLEQWLGQISRGFAPLGHSLWGVNMIVHPTYDRFDAELDLICQYRPRLVVTALGNPGRVTDRVHEYGGAVFADVISVAHARKAIAGGADGLILVTAGAGGHTGTLNPFAFVEEVRQFWHGPIALAGGIASGRAIHAARVAGADLAYLGTHFIAARESLVSDENRAMLGQCGSADIVTTDAVSGVMANWMRPSLEKAGLAGQVAQKAKLPDFSNLHASSKAWKDIWGAGHGVGQTPGMRPMADIIDELEQQYTASRQRDHG